MSAFRYGDFPSVDEIIEKMRDAGDWYRRKRKYVLPSLWRYTTPANPKLVEAWMRETFPLPWANYGSPHDMKRLAEAVIAELRYHDHGLPALPDEVVALIDGGAL
jgi:hypothetical protein